MSNPEDSQCRCGHTKGEHCVMHADNSRCIACGCRGFRPRALSRKRKQELMRDALAYAGELVRQVVKTYEAFEDLPDVERAFIDEYIVGIGNRLLERSRGR